MEEGETEEYLNDNERSKRIRKEERRKYKGWICGDIVSIGTLFPGQSVKVIFRAKKEVKT